MGTSSPEDDWTCLMVHQVQMVLVMAMLLVRGSVGYPGRALLGAQATRDPALLPAEFKCSNPSQMILELNMGADSKPQESKLCASSDLPTELGESEREETKSRGSKGSK